MADKEKPLTKRELKEKGLKKCNYKGKVLPLSEFKMLKRGVYDSFSIEGRKLYQQEYRKNNSERKNEYDKKYRENKRLREN